MCSHEQKKCEERDERARKKQKRKSRRKTTDREREAAREKKKQKTRQKFTLFLSPNWWWWWCSSVVVLLILRRILTTIKASESCNSSRALSKEAKERSTERRERFFVRNKRDSEREFETFSKGFDSSRIRIGFIGEREQKRLSTRSSLNDDESRSNQEAVVVSLSLLRVQEEKDGIKAKRNVP